MTAEEKKFGVNVWWTVPAAVVDGVKAQEALVKHGFERTDIELPSRRKEVSRACQSFQNRRTTEQRRITEKTQDNGKYVVYGILDQKRVDDEQVRFKQTTTVYLDKDTDAVRAEGALVDEVLEAVKSYEGKITDEDIRGFLRAVIKMCLGVAKRPNGGIYFVPARHANIVESAQGVLDELGTGAKLYIEGVNDGQREREYVWESVEANIDSEIEEALLAAERISRSANAVSNQQTKIEKLGEMMDVYRGLLGKEAEYEGVAERIEEAVKTVSEKMASLQDGKPAAPKKAKKSGQKTTKPRGSNVFEAAVTVLSEADAPMHYKAITQAMIENGSYAGTGKYAKDSVRKILQLGLDNGDDRIVVVKKGVYKAA